LGASVTYTFKLTVTVTEIVLTIKAPEFNYTNGTGFELVKIDDDEYWVTPKFESAKSGQFASIKTVNGKTIYATKSTVVYKDNSSDFNSYHNIFDQFSITNYTQKGQDAPGITYDSTYSGTGNDWNNAGFSWVSGGAPGGQGWQGFSKYNNQFTRYGKYGSDATAQEQPAQFSFKAGNGITYYYYVQYSYASHTRTSGCVTGDTLVTLADGTQKRVDELTGTELLRVWDHTTGKISSAPIAYIVNHDETISEHDVLKMNFSDGNYLEIIGEHVFYNKTLNKYIAITADNVNEYIGDVFVSNEGNGLKEVTLVDAENIVRNTGVYEVVTYKAITCFTNGILSASAYLDPLLNVFDMDADTMVYDVTKMMEDIATYGLYTYDDFKDLVPEEAFEMYNAAYLKIAVGKGYIDWNDILDLIEIYYNNDVTPLK